MSNPEPISDDAWSQEDATIPDFWKSISLDELAARQGVAPLSNARALFGTWPGDIEDGFEILIDSLRHSPFPNSES